MSDSIPPEKDPTPNTPPAEDDIADTDLDSVAGGGGSGSYTYNCAFTSNCSGADL